MIDYRQKINSIYNKSQKNSISDNRFVEILELFCDYCRTSDIEGLTADNGHFLSVLADSVEKAMKYYKTENGDFFFYTLKIIKLDIRQAKKEEYDSIKSVIDIPETSKRQLAKTIKQIEKFANSKGININKINDTELKMISEEIGFDVDKIKELLTRWRAAKETEAFIVKKEDDDGGESEEIQNPGIKYPEDSPEKIIEKKEQKQQQQKKQKQYFSMINDVYMSLSPTKKNSYKVVLINFFIDSMFDDNTDTEKMETILKQFKFYDETDNRINQVVKDFIKTGKSKTQEELAKIIDINKDTVSKIQKHFKNLFLEQVALGKLLKDI